MRLFLEVVEQGSVYSVTSMKSETNQLLKCNLHLKDPVGKYPDKFAVTLLGDLAAKQFKPGDKVLAELSFNTSTYNGSLYQDIIVRDIILF